jgi:phosphatidylinositol kinase/protein kinase (PI-3  family)
VVKIAHIHPTLLVVESKQHPRKCVIVGSDGRNYAFLLKGREDMRQDERVMQLFSLVNTLLANDRETEKSDLGIVRYEVVPLSPTSGVCEWVPNCDTVHAVIKQYRDARKILLNIEQKLIMKMSPDYQLLTVIQKVEVFQFALSMTTGQDLCKVLWLKSPNAETWLQRRTNYTKSLAVMSMVGYILGLGDRHPCNLMLDRYSGKIVHIDFGDCFEVAMHRDKYPEKVPFRLTRMLINALEVSGIEGTFRTTCEEVMSVLRDNRNSLMTLLEAFVYDPLINWKLLAAADTKKEESKEAAEEGSVAEQGEQGKRRGKAKTGETDAMVADPSNNSTSLTVAEETPAMGGGPSPAAAAAAASEEAQHQQQQGINNNPLVQEAPATQDGGVVAVGSSPVERKHPALSRAPSGNGVVAVGSSPDHSPKMRSSYAPSLSLRDPQRDEVLNTKAVSVVARVASKLNGTDFNEEAEINDSWKQLTSDSGKLRVLDVKDQVDRLIEEATSHENLSGAYLGWCSFW